MQQSALRRAAPAIALVLLLCAVRSGPATADDDAYRVGRGIADITGPPLGIKMLGYVRAEQITEGIHLRQFSRAFVIADLDDKRHLAIVTTDLQSVTHSLVLSVLERLRDTLGDDLYNVDNVVIAATHTHAVPGGYWHYGADTPLGAPLNDEHYRAIVAGIADSIAAAHRDLAPGRILVAQGDVEAGGAQRSLPAYLNNPAGERDRYPGPIDTQMIQLTFERDGRPIGILNWHAVHPTSMSYHNHLISSDNKGYAAYAFERRHNAGRASDDGPFVAAFAQSNCGDVTPNLTLDQHGPGKDEFESTRIIGDRQVAAAEKLFASAGEPLTGPLDYRQAYVDFSCLTVRDEFTGAGDQQTCPAAYGYSFAAGSTEDGGGQEFLFKEGMLKTDGMIETIAKTVLPLPRPDEALRRAHAPKPILLPVGAADPPMLPNVIPLGVARIGQLALAIGPAEYTTMSGRRFRTSVQQALPGVKYVVVAGYANDYIGYVATREEYEKQNYEGAATLFGPWTQAGYQQEFARLAADIAEGRPSQTHEPPLDMRGLVRPTPLGTKFDEPPPGAAFGDLLEDAQPAYDAGQPVVAAFWSGNPRNGYRADRAYATIERQENGRWVPAILDADWDVKVRWNHPPVAGKSRQAACACTVEWLVPEDMPPGTYRITHQGVYKTQADAAVHEFTARSRPFEIR